MTIARSASSHGVRACFISAHSPPRSHLHERRSRHFHPGEGENILNVEVVAFFATSGMLYSLGTFTTSSPKAKAMCAKVFVVKLWRPVSHLDTSDSFFPSRCANIRWDIPFSFSRKSILSAMAKESSNSALVSSETLARHSLNNALVFIN